MARHYRFFILIASALVLFSGIFLFSGISRADESVFTIDGVKVDVTAESAVAARGQAFEKAQQEAFRMLAERLLPEGEAKTFTVPALSTISPMVKDFEITGEQLSRVQYIGTYTFRFKEHAIRNFFADRNVSFTDIPSKPILVLPFYQNGKVVTLWGENNPWLAAWSRTKTNQGLVPVQIPIGDIADVGDITDAQALTYNSVNLHNMTGRYDAGEAIILIAQPKWSATQKPEPEALDVMLYRTDLTAPVFVKTISVTETDKTSDETLFDAAVRVTRQAFQSDWKTKTSVTLGGEKSTINARVRFRSLREWAETQKALRQVSAVSYMRVVRLSPKQAEIELTYSGTMERLQQAFAEAHVGLSDSIGDGLYELSLYPAE